MNARPLPVHMITESVEKRFWEKVQKTDGCWLWTAATSHGYGTMYVGDGEYHRAHRIAYVLKTREDLSAEGDVMHSCDVRSCVRFDHLSHGTRTLNMRDMATKKRGNWIIAPETVNRGSNVGTSLLTEDDVRAIRSAHDAGETQVAIAKRYRVTQACVSLIVLRRAWRHVA